MCFRGLPLSGKQVILAVGNVPAGASGVGDEWPGLRTFFPGGEHDDDTSVAWGDNDTFLRCDGCGRVRLVNAAYTSMKGACCEGDRLAPLNHAFDAARSARFEHGEGG